MEAINIVKFAQRWLTSDFRGFTVSPLRARDHRKTLRTCWQRFWSERGKANVL